MQVMMEKSFVLYWENNLREQHHETQAVVELDANAILISSLTA
jgi:hypothetical protein